MYIMLTSCVMNAAIKSETLHGSAAGVWSTEIVVANHGKFQEGLTHRPGWRQYLIYTLQHQQALLKIISQISVIFVVLTTFLWAWYDMMLIFWLEDITHHTVWRSPVQASVHYEALRKLHAGQSESLSLCCQLDVWAWAGHHGNHSNLQLNVQLGLTSDFT